MESNCRCGSLRRAAVLVLVCVVTAIVLPGQTLTTLATFDGTNGANPIFGPLAQGLDGNLYGTTNGGGSYGPNCVPGCGTVFKITPTGMLTTLYSFCIQTNCADGAYPLAGLVLATDGSLYGTTNGGGPSSNCAGGCGTVFKIAASGMLTTLYSFSLADGAYPESALFQGTNGNFYGTTQSGGTNGGYGTVFEITRSGMLTTLHSFDGTDGQRPVAGLVQATNGNFYGTTVNGGTYGNGTVFTMTPSGTLTTLRSLYNKVGRNPYGVLVQAANGDFYGTTDNGGNYDEGTVFQISPHGILTTLYSFAPPAINPSSGLMQATDGNWYGTTTSNDDNNGVYFGGVMFSMTPGGTVTNLYDFCLQNFTPPLSCPDGSFPNGTLMQATNGNFYGTTTYGGLSTDCSNQSPTGGCGTVFMFSVGLGPFIKTLPASGKIGSAVKILGTTLTGATSVTFNGVPATFTVVRASEITTTVPTGATTGTVQVVTPTAALTSNVAFRVR